MFCRVEAFSTQGHVYVESTSITSVSYVIPRPCFAAYFKSTVLMHYFFFEKNYTEVMKKKINIQNLFDSFKKITHRHFSRKFSYVKSLIDIFQENFRM